MQIEEAKNRYDFMSNVEVTDFLRWSVDKDAQGDIDAAAARQIPGLIPQDFWNAVYDYDAWSNGNTQLEKIFHARQGQTLTLGKIYGQTTLKLILWEGALPSNEDDFEDSGFVPPFDYAKTDGGAISYPGGHPSENKASSKTKASTTPTITPDQDDKLRRFTSLGYVITESGGKTGHVLVIDMDDKNSRQRHPWFVLAHEWRTDGDSAGEHGDIYHYADSEPGTLPGDKVRTPICRIEPLNNNHDRRPVITQFGDNFSFMPVRLGGHRMA